MILTPELISRLSPLELKARQIVEGFITGLHKSPFFGFSVEFAQHRSYNPGDELRHIDWKVYGKTERFYVKQYEEETNLRCYMVLDVSSSMDFRHFGVLSKMQYASYFGASLLYLMHRQRDACGLALFDDTLETLVQPKSSYAHLRYLFQKLEPYSGQRQSKQKRRKTASAEVLHQLAERIPRRSLIVLLSDLFENTEQHDALLSALKHLRHRNHEVILFHLLEKKSERDLDFADGRYLFEDLETGARIDIIPEQIRNDYQKQIQVYTDRFKRVCSEARIDYEEIDTQGRYDLGLLAYLTKRKRLL